MTTATLCTPDVTDLMARVGARVRHAREAKAIPRRVLSEMSGVSSRYLAQLEAGEGNISLSVLTRVAAALGLRLEEVLGEQADERPVAGRVQVLFDAASPETQTEILRLLQHGQAARAQRICLVGLRGAGKSTLGLRLGQALGLPFVELNREIEGAAGMPVDEIMALYGQEGYRKLEADALTQVIARHDRLVLAVAGGLVAEHATYEQLLARCHTVWLKARPEEHMARVRAQGDERPMAGNPEAMAQLRSILRSRERLYERAHAQLDTSGVAVTDSVRALQALVRARGFVR